MLTSIIAVISGETLIRAVGIIIVVALLYWLFTWALSQAPIPEPANKIVRVLLLVLLVLVIANVLLGLIGYPIIRI